MQSKYKVGLLRGNLILAALLPALMAPTAPDVSEALLLWLAAGWLGITALLVEFSHRRPALVPWQLLPSLLLAALLWIGPERHPLWLWAWAALIMLPQPTWMVVMNVLLAGLSWSWVARQLPPEQALVAGLVLALLLVLGLSRSHALTPLHDQARRRVSLVPGLRLWTGNQLGTDLPREHSRVRRDGNHCELLLIRTRRRHFWPVAQRLCQLTRSFEHCYRLDGRTLATLLLSRDLDQAEQRREALLERLTPVVRLRAVPLEHLDSLVDECRALDRQATPVTIARRPADD